ncbi:4-alpha-L-fucosyltransferase [Tritonibacter multivorans]|uniref:4-alpha-L-fucosyltransferase n=1 Tax=Tritonibacter multivorans TaxID=928856 RepID=A0A0P1FZF9_9RHOB|nr:TDP-N-acetylfucosamine:lipid II N-acetylfucosaminyltransferase [Tritonibacter multivorans]MDA7422195.1 TDP-N-acetylfucosamine:lipid II N-acetylfucosaminyltransferase [Tritonibacter multivorans]CUH74786.1 4-alpha-L-fucosyltransferase [Tritonibacter multivorans]SFD80185.1 dTDP-N-acetylfucosamine:lipid II N-acetylfucosaminyltransferase [Tritonibacter multivorans]
MKFWHVIPDSNHAVSLANNLREIDHAGEHEILMYHSRGHQKSYIENTMEIFPRTSILGKNLSFGEKDIVVAHGVFTQDVINLFDAIYAQGIKTAWSIWGGDLHLLAPLKGGMALMNRFSCVITAPGELLLYPDLHTPEVHGCLYKLDGTLEMSAPEKEDLIILGNSGDPSNNHLYLLDIAQKFEGYQVHVPFAYNATEDYTQTVLEKAASLGLSDRMTLQTDILSLEDYSDLLARARIFLAGHDRQQAVGSISIAYQNNCRVYLKKAIKRPCGREMVNPGYMHLQTYGFVDIQDVFDLEDDATVNALMRSAPAPNRIAEINALSVEHRLATFEKIKRACGVA